MSAPTVYDSAASPPTHFLCNSREVTENRSPPPAYDAEVLKNIHIIFTALLPLQHIWENQCKNRHLKSFFSFLYFRCNKDNMLNDIYECVSAEKVQSCHLFSIY